MDTLSNPAATEPEFPLTEAGQAALRDDVLGQLRTLPFPPGRQSAAWNIPCATKGRWLCCEDRGPRKSVMRISTSSA